jgi:hypothetical protein
VTFGNGLEDAPTSAPAPTDECHHSDLGPGASRSLARRVTGRLCRRRSTHAPYRAGILVTLPGVGDMSGRVEWSLGSGFGCKFETHLSLSDVQRVRQLALSAAGVPSIEGK